MKLTGRLLALLLLTPAGLLAQARYSASIAVFGGTRLVRDRIFQDISLKQKLAPTFLVGASLPVAPEDRVGIEVGLGFGGSTVSEDGVGDVGGPSYRTLSATLGYEGPIFWRFRYRASAGVLKYLPTKEDLFRQGGPAVLLLGFATEYRLPIRKPFDVTATLRYDFHRFTTRELQDRGFARNQDVHRLALGVGIGFTRK